jgi:hypothetical protein
MRVAYAAQILNVSHPTAWQTVKILQDTTILQKVTGRDWGQKYELSFLA